ncbi:POTRA domain-containing protein [Flavobacterium terrae]|uniref:POTRA domain-containing protein n=1 Tax=Flavobacterium terrae TaxID=415425 RepID=A0A1M6FXA1_9FLAO|nr:POTRA domain-containing protein [Flavobacterium terrae]SHJ02229.1 hypothetical protein SAMN05444363_2391 [Flavobacterium terrae]
MRINYLLFFFIFYFQTSFGQNFYYQISSNNAEEIKKIDSIGYQKKHTSVKSILDEEQKLVIKYSQIGYFEASFENIKKVNDSTFSSIVSLNQLTQKSHIYISNELQNANPKIFEANKDTIKINSSEVETYMNSVLYKFEKAGFPLVKIRLKNHEQKNNILYSELEVKNEKRRTLDNIVINGYEKFPKSHLKNILRFYKNKTFNQENLEKLNNDFNKFKFVKQTKYPEILFTKDSTKVYVYLEKNKANSFDGFIGFTNDDERQKLVINGYLDLKFQNLLNGGEKINIYWKSDGKNQKTFNASTELPYLFKSPLGIKAQLYIFKQDSIFQNTQTNLDLGYYFNYNTRAYIGYQEAESSNIQNTVSTNLSDFSNVFYTASLDYIDNDINSILFPDKTLLNIKFGTGKRETSKFNDNQYFAKIDVSHNFYLNQKNSVNLKSQNAYLKSSNYLINELFRFGGINSIRGFNENSLQGNLFGSLLLEYRYLTTQNLYIHTITDYAYLQDKATNQNNSLLGLGLGLGLLTKNGLFKIVYANGSTGSQNIELKNSIVQISFKSQF